MPWTITSTSAPTAQAFTQRRGSVSRRWTASTSGGEADEGAEQPVHVLVVDAAGHARQRVEEHVVAEGIRPVGDGEAGLAAGHDAAGDQEQEGGRGRHGREGRGAAPSRYGRRSAPPPARRAPSQPRPALTSSEPGTHHTAEGTTTPGRSPDSTLPSTSRLRAPASRPGLPAAAAARGLERRPGRIAAGDQDQEQRREQQPARRAPRPGKRRT